MFTSCYLSTRQVEQCCRCNKGQVCTPLQNEAGTIH